MEHWVERFSGMPEEERKKFVRFASIEQAWRECEDGAALIWLAHQIAPDVARRTEVRRAAAQAAFQITESLYRYWNSTVFREFNDPVVLAHHVAMESMLAATGFYRVGERATPPNWPIGREEYSRVSSELRRMAAEVVRERIPAP
jgi:hypothetical protein